MFLTPWPYSKNVPFKSKKRKKKKKIKKKDCDEKLAR